VSGGGERPLRLGVVVTNCDTWELTLACLERLAPLRAELADVVVVDDASSRPAPRELPGGARLLANPERLGLVRSLNRGIRAVAADVVVLFDSDAYPLADFTGEVRRRFAADPTLAIAGFRTVDRAGRETGSHQGEPGAASLVLGQRLHALWLRLAGGEDGPVCVYTCAMALSRAAFDGLGGFDEGFDWLDLDVDLCMRARRAGWQVVHVPALAAFHEGAGTPQRTSERVLRFYKNRWRLLRKFGRIRRPALVRGLIVGRLAGELAALRLLGPLLVRDREARRDKLAGRRRTLEHVRLHCR
jgi:GT2 family glycosyltransferase